MNAPHDANRRTVAAYERYARQYALAVSRQPSAPDEEALRRLAAAVPSGGVVLEFGSGPGWDADFLETLGVEVRRTDVAEAFRVFQAERGKQVEPFDLLADEIEGVYGGMMLLCVVQHFERADVGRVLNKLRRGLADGGTLLLSHPVGNDDRWEHGASGDYRVVRWTAADMDARLAQAGFGVDWQVECDGEEGLWRTVTARNRA